MSKQRIAVIGASGYTALELFRLLLRHPHAEIAAVTSREENRPRVSELHRSLTGRLDVACEAFDPDALAGRVDFAFLTLPHGAAMAAAKPLVERGIRVIDLSADYRLSDPNVYAEWYGASHSDTDNLKHAVYGLPELYEPAIANARLIANPGCYPTTAILGLSPLLSADLIERTDIIIDSKSGVSGAGRTPKLPYHFPECNESFSAYGIGRHRHTPEICQVLSDVAKAPVDAIFTPHLVPMDKGILSTIYARRIGTVDEKHLLDMYRDYYAGKPFVRLVDHLPATKDVRDTNFCDITVRVVKDRVLVISCIDNLIKGASGAAVQNFNVMCGYDQTTGLL